MRKLGRAFWAAIFTLLGAGSAMAGEEAEYTVVLKEDLFEVREYTPHIVAETIVDGDFEDAGGEAFDRLFKYISGNNKSREKVEMTAPVGQAAESQKINMTSPVGQKQVEGRWAVSFMMPASFTLETLPKPNDQNVILRQVPARHMAAVRYSGFWSEEGYERNKAKLDAWIDAKGFITAGEAVWARYNPPFMPWFLRRNEILLPIDDLPHNE
jgi:effector-binding domain-containing protein